MRRSLKDAFIPHAGNDYTPPVLQRVAIMAMFAMVVMTFTAANLQALFWHTSDWLVSTVLPGVIVELTNDERTDNAAVPLRRSSVLDAAATLKAEHMAHNQYFAHYSPDGTSPWYWFDQVDYRFAHAGENLAIHFSDSDEVVDAWMASPSHRANIIDQKFTEIGVGTARGTYQGYDTVYVVQLFGTPAAPVAASTVTVAESRPAPAEATVLAERITTEPSSLPAASPASSTIPISASDTPLATTSTPALVSTTSVSSVAPTEPPPAAASATPTSTDLTEVAVDDDSISLYSGTIASSSGHPPAALTASASPTESAPLIGRLATQPTTFIQLAYLLLGLFVAVALGTSVVIELQHQRPAQVAYGLVLLLLMSGLFYLHTLVTSGALIA